MADKHPLSLRERARVRGESRTARLLLPPHPAFGHLLPDAHGECTFPDTWYEVLIRRKQGVEVEAGLVARIQDLRLECRAEQRKLLKILRCSSSLIRHEEVY